MTHFEITHAQATTLAAFLHELRPDWDQPGIIDALGKARNRADRADLAVAAIRAAETTGNRTPAIIAHDGPHWRTPEPRTPIPPLPRNPRCEKCHTKHPADTPCGQVREGLSDTAAAGIAEARQALADLHASGVLCGCGIPRVNCNRHREVPRDDR